MDVTKITSKQWALLLASSVGLAVFNIFVLNLLIVSVIAGALNGSFAMALTNSIMGGKATKAIEAAKIDGRTQKEWYDLISVMTKEEYERLSRPALDGLEDSSDGYGGWDIKRLLTNSDYHKIMRGWYPDKYCSFCDGFTNGIPGNCMWDGPCHGYAADKWRRDNEILRKHRAELIRDHMASKKKDELVIKSPPRAKAIPVKGYSQIDKEIQELKAELVKWDRNFQKTYYDYNYYNKKYNK